MNSKIPVCYLLYSCSSVTEPATLLIQSSRSALQDSENATLNCTAHDGYPPPSSISWVKNGRVISTTSDDQLVITVAANDTHAFGQYKCVVNNSVTTMETTFLMKQKGVDILHLYNMRYTNIETLQEARVGTCSSCLLKHERVVLALSFIR